LRPEEDRRSRLHHNRWNGIAFNSKQRIQRTKKDIATMRKLALLFVVVLSFASLLGCQKTAPSAPTADQERQLQQQIDQARQAEGAAQKTAK
jgi:hypothetical protein